MKSSIPSCFLYLSFILILFACCSTKGDGGDILRSNDFNRNNNKKPSLHPFEHQVVYALNAGGGEHTDANGISFQKDPFQPDIVLDTLLGTINRVPPEDQILFQTKRRNQEPFGYDIPIPYETSSYILVLLFSETTNNQRKANVFDVVLNNQHTVVSSLDIFTKVGFGNAHQEVIAFKVQLSNEGPVLLIANGESDIENGVIRMEFISKRGHSSLNAFYVFKGDRSDVRWLQRLRSVDIHPSKQIYAVNCGGEDHTDVYGVSYHKDPINVGIASSHGMTLDRIYRVHHDDEILYRSERYSTGNFGYNIHIKEDGSYVLVMKFSEVWFVAPHKKVFDVEMNHKHKIVKNLDIFAEVGWATAHDVTVPFIVQDGVSKLSLNGEISQITNGDIYLEFQKGRYDNPKINAFYVIRGTPSDVPPMPGLPIQSQMKKPYNLDVVEDWGLDDDQMDRKDGEIGDDDENFAQGSSYVKSRHQSSNDRPFFGDHDPWKNESDLAIIYPLIFAISLAALTTYIVCVKFRPGL